MPLIGAKSILLCSDDGNNVRTAQRWAKEHAVSAACASVCTRARHPGREGSAACGHEGDTRCAAALRHAPGCSTSRVTLVAGVSSATDLANAYHKINTTAFALDAISSLWNLGLCRAFVGTFS
jgi:hypothetical protein